MYIFGVDIPLVQLLFVLAALLVILGVIVLLWLIKMRRLSEELLKLEEEEIEELERLGKRIPQEHLERVKARSEKKRAKLTHLFKFIPSKSKFKKKEKHFSFKPAKKEIEVYRDEEERTEL